MVGLNFSSEDEANKFLRAMETKIKDSQNRRQSNICLAIVFIICHWKSLCLALKQKKDNSFTRPVPSSPPSHPAPSLPSTMQPNCPRSSPLTTIPEPSHSINVTTPVVVTRRRKERGKRLISLTSVDQAISSSFVIIINFVMLWLDI